MGMSVEHGPQRGLVKRSTAGSPASRNVPSEVASPERLFALNAGAGVPGARPNSGIASSSSS